MEATDALRKELVALAAIRDSLIKENEQLRHQLQESEAGELLEELEELKRECEDRVATAEKTIIVLRGERETLTRKLERAEKDRDSQKALLAERDGTIQQLRAEGEALSQKHGDGVQQVRRLKASLREMEAVRDELAAKLAAADANAEVRLLRNESLAEGEREKQIDLESAIRDQAAEIQRLASHAAEREEALRAEVVQLQRLCATLQAARDEQAASHVDAALPLMRQVEDMQRASRAAADAASETMSRLQARLREAEIAAVAAESAERAAKSRAAAAEEALGDKSLRVTALTKEVADLSLRLGQAEANCGALGAEVAALRKRHDDAGAAQTAAEARARAAYEDVERLTRMHGDAKRAWAAREAELLSAVDELRGGTRHASRPGPTDQQASPAEHSSALERRVLELEAQRKREAAQLLQAEQRAMQAEAEARNARGLSQQLTELRLRHNKCLELLGERQRRVEELALDVVEAREIYKAQILSLLPK